MSFLVFTERRIAKKQYDLAPCCMSADDDDEEKQQPQQQPPKEGKDSAKPTSTEFVEWFREKPLKWYASFITGKTGTEIGRCHTHVYTYTYTRKSICIRVRECDSSLNDRLVDCPFSPLWIRGIVHCGRYGSRGGAANGRSGSRWIVF